MQYSNSVHIPTKSAKPKIIYTESNFEGEPTPKANVINGSSNNARSIVFLIAVRVYQIYIILVLHLIFSYRSKKNVYS